MEASKAWVEIHSAVTETGPCPLGIKGLSNQDWSSFIARFLRFDGHHGCRVRKRVTLPRFPMGKGITLHNSRLYADR